MSWHVTYIVFRQLWRYTRCNEIGLYIISSSREPESFGRVAVEAQSMNKPVIATAHGGSIETKHHNKTGILAKPGSIDGMALAIKEIIEKKELYAVLSPMAETG